MSKNRKSDIEYKPQEIESRWQRYWEENGIFSPDLKNAKKPFYNLMMFPYPSAEGLHVGNMYAFTGADVHGRYQRMRGNDVFEPIGLDGFGIHSENYALKVGRHPAKQAEISGKNFYRQLRATGNAYDWTRTLETYTPAYYRWTQWIFVQMFKKGLAYRKKAQVNWCPSCKTVLADEQVIQKDVGARRLPHVANDARLHQIEKSKAISRSSLSEHKHIMLEGGSKVNRGLAFNSFASEQSPRSQEKIAACERCETEVEKRELEQWFFRITEYADRLLSGLDKIDWPEKIKIAQRQWIGRSEGARIKFQILPIHTNTTNTANTSIEVFTTRQDTLFGATFLVLAPEHPIVASLLNSIPIKSGQNSKLGEIRKYVKRAKSRSDKERIEGAKEKTGVFSGLHAINPANNEEIPIWIADYAVMGYGTGALFGDAHDERDVEFAKKYNIALRPTLLTGDKKRDERIKRLEECFTGEGTLFDSGEFSGMSSEEAKKKISAWLKKHNAGGPEITYHLRDWLISRQRYWGPPIPMVSCSKCAGEGKSWFDTDEASSIHNSEFIIHNSMRGWYPVPEEDLPVLLPDVEDWRPRSSPENSGPSGQAVEGPLANHPEFYKTKCPSCSYPARRETDVSDTFLDSAWYYLRYLSAGVKKSKLKVQSDEKNDSDSSDEYAYDIDLVKKWCPVAIYIGGAEHSVLHLLYVRFVAMVLHDLKNDPSTHFDSAQRRHSVRSGWNVSALALPFQEPFPRFYAHGLLISEGAKMSKSKGNVVIPDEYVKKYGADTLRMYLMFLGPFDQGGDFRDTGMEGMHRFVKRLWRLFTQVKSGKLKVQSLPEERLRVMHRTIKAVTQDIEQLSYNTAIARLMEWYNFLTKQLTTGNRQLTTEEAEVFLKLLAPFAPHMTEELWARLSVLSSQLSEGSRSVNQLTGQQKTGKPDSENRKQKTDDWSIHFQEWPKYDERHLVEEQATVVVQVNGKRRGEITIDSLDINKKEEIEALARKEVEKYVQGKNVKNVVYVPGRIINFVV